MMKFAVEPERPHLEESGVGDDFINVTLTPGEFDKNEGRPVGSGMYVKYRKAGDDEWETLTPTGKWSCFGFSVFISFIHFFGQPLREKCPRSNCCCFRLLVV